MKYVKNGKNYDVGPMGFTSDYLERLRVKVTNWSVMADNWRTCVHVIVDTYLMFVSTESLLYIALLRHCTKHRRV